MLGAIFGRPISGVIVSGATTTTMAANVGAFVLSGKAAIFRINAVAALGTFNLTGQAVLFRLLMPAGIGTFIFTGKDANLFATLGVFPVSAGAFLLTGRNVQFAEIIRRRPRPKWDYEYKPGRGPHYKLNK